MKKGLTKSNINKRELTQQVLDLLEQNAGFKYSMKRIFQELKYSAHPVRMMCVDVLNALVDDGTIMQDDHDDYYIEKVSHTAEGTFNRTSGGRNFVDTDDGIGIAIYDEDTMHALPGDRVRVSMYAKRRGSNKMHGQVVEILQRSEKPFVGTLQIQHDTAFLIHPTDILPQDILIPQRMLNGGVNGDKVVVKVVEWPEHSRNPIGEVVQVLGKEGDNETEMHAILAAEGSGRGCRTARCRYHPCRDSQARGLPRCAHYDHRPSRCQGLRRCHLHS